LIPEDKKREVKEYLLALEKPSGGFAFSRTVPSGIEDTYFAIQALDTLGLDKDYSATREWLAKEKWDSDPTGRVLYYRIRLYKRLALEVPWYRVTAEIEKALTGVKGNPRKLDFFGRILALAQEEGVTWPKLEELLLQEAEKVDRSITTKDTLESLWRKVRVCMVFGGEMDTQRLLEHLEACYNPDGGYGFKPHTTSFLEHIHFAYRLYQALKYAPHHREETRAFVLNSQSKRGGFARAPGGVPFIDTTFYALRVLRALEEKRKETLKGGEKYAELVSH